MKDNQRKVSIVSPCYNKEAYIGEMLDSVIAQEWDNIELILVNDGSTDGTRELISEYEPKLKKRGFEVVIIDQENAGCCAAVYAGLVRMTGDYFCLVDCDDELDPRYVSLMATWLERNADCDVTACSYTARIIPKSGKKITTFNVSALSFAENEPYVLENHIMRREITTSWVFMWRMSYLIRSGLVENFYTGRSATYEPLFAVPLFAHKPKLKCFEEPLYIFNRTHSDLYRFDNYSTVEKYYYDYSRLYLYSIDRLKTGENEKARLKAIVRLFNKMDILYHLHHMDPIGATVADAEDHRARIAEETEDVIKEMFRPTPSFDYGLLGTERYMEIFSTLRESILNKFPFAERRRGARIIYYGALGKIAQTAIPRLKESSWAPDMSWDVNAGDDGVVVAPDYGCLKDGDVIVIFPKSEEILKDVHEKINDAGMAGSVVVRSYSEFSGYIQRLKDMQGVKFRYA